MAPRNSSQPCEYVLLAEFDIDEGSMLRHEYPVPTGCDGHLLAELMLPDGAHQRTEDWTIFYLNQTRATTVQKEILAAETGQGSIDDHEASTTGSSRRDLLYVMSLVRTKHSSAYKRGALVKALAVCSSRPYIQIFKPILLLALEDYFSEPTPSVLKRMYEAINSVDTSLAPSLSLDERMVLRCSERRDLFEEKFAEEASAISASATSPTSLETPSSIAKEDRLAHLNIPGGGDSELQPRSRVTSDNSTVSATGMARTNSSKTAVPGSAKNKSLRDTHYFETSVFYNDLSLPIRLPLYTFPHEVGDYSIITLISTFSNFTSTQGLQHPHLHTNGSLTPPIIVLFNALVTYKRVLFLGGVNQPASQVSNFVLSAAALGSGCGMYFGSEMTERCFPYSNLTNLDNVLGVPGYVAGVSNPRFEDLSSTWDVLCNIETGRIHISKDIQQAPSSATSTYSPSTNASQLSLSTSSAATHSSQNNGIRTQGHASNQSLELSPDTFSAVSGTLPFGSNGTGLPNSSSDSDIGRAPAREASITSTGGVMGGSTVASSGASFAPSTSTTTASAGKDAQMPRIEARIDTFDNTFMDEIIAAIQSHFGEAVIRARLIDYMRRFVRLASRYEEDTYGTTSIDYPTLSFVPGRLGSGLVFYTNNAEEVKREIQSNAGRIEGWRRTKSYDSYKRDWMQSQVPQSQQNPTVFSLIRAIKGVDLHHQISRLRNSKRMSGEEVEHICRMLRDNVKTDEQVVEVLAHLPSHFGGLLPLAFGLFHPSSSVRECTIDFLNTVNAHPTGHKFVQSMNAFHRLAYARLASERGMPSTPSHPGLPYKSARSDHARKASIAASHRSHTTSNGSGSGEGFYGKMSDKDVPPLPPMSA
ncbi:spindle pole body interacting protein [Cystobasidium minutum MCA 4210]|uniref:spindle pole body interacting protein n=1 Tax=Cystobasidium minutum MCA 4210 TaxID=1397322 RepID=UPI0034CE4B9E|eukprot:jgi/Rhomi1/36050/CE36049_519